MVGNKQSLAELSWLDRRSPHELISLTYSSDTVNGECMAKTIITTPINSTIEWEGVLLPDTLVTINGELEVSLGSLIAHTHGEALDWLAEYLPKKPKGF